MPCANPTFQKIYVLKKTIMGALHTPDQCVPYTCTKKILAHQTAIFARQKFTLALLIFLMGFVFTTEKMSAQCDNVINGGIIEADEFGCPEPQPWDPSEIISVSLPEGGSGALEFIWMMTTDDPQAPVSQWVPIPNTNSANFDPGPISVTTYYRRCARRAGCVEYVGESNIVTKEAICCDNVTDGGQIGNDQAACLPPFTPFPLENEIVPTGGTQALEYQWVMSTTGTPYTPLNTDWTEIPDANSINFSPGELTETTYFIRLSRRYGCLDYGGVSNIVTITIGTEIIPSLAGNDATCMGANNASVSVSNINGGVPGFTYQWDDADNSTTDAILDSAPGTYSLTVTDDIGCTGTASITVADGPALMVTTSVMGETCPGDMNGQAMVTSVDGTAPYVYLWNDPASQTTETATNLAAASYQVVVTDGIGCIGTGTADVPGPEPLALTTTSTQASCSDIQDGTATVAVTGGTSPYIYVWNDAAAQTTATAFNLAFGNYEVTVTDANGCSSSATVTVTAPMMAMLELSSTDVTCFGSANGSAQASITGGDPAFYSFLWNDAAGTMSNTVTGLGMGDYMVTVTDTVGCMVEGSVSISEPPQLLLTVNADSASCWNSSDGTAIVLPTGGTPFAGGEYQYIWNAPGNPMVQMLDDVNPGTYAVTVIDANDCQESASVEIGAPTQTLVSFDITHVSCAGAADGTLTATANGGTPPHTYQWGVAGNPTGATISNLAPGTYDVTVTDANNCMVFTSATVTEPSALSLGFSNTNVICEPDMNGVAQAMVSGGTSPYTFLWGNGATTTAIGNLGVGSYAVTVTDANGCTISGATQIIFTSTLNSTASGTDATCFDVGNGSATAAGIDGMAPYSYLWSNGETTATITGLFFNSYSVTVTDANGCTSASSASVGAPPLLQCNANIISNVLTFDGTEGAASASASGGVQPYEFAWSSGSNTETATGLGAGIHTVTVTDANGCNCIREITLVNPSKIGDFIWNDENQNGIQDVGEVGLEGITLHLTGQAGNGDPVAMTTMTDGMGEYAFDGLTDGFYEIEMELPPNHVLTYQNVGVDDLDSDFDQDNRKTPTFALAQGVYASKWDGGIIVLDEFVDIGDFVWYDMNHNGIQDQNEAGVEGITVRLITMPDNQIIAQTSTDQLGYYIFEDVTPGDYMVHFTLASFPSGGYVLSPKDQGTDDTKDSDPNILTGRTDVFTVFPFTFDKLDIDAGIYKECDNITDGGLIGYNEDLCGVGADPSEIVNVQYPSGGYGVIEYLWMQSSVPIYNGPGDPNWSVIPNSNSESYDPGPIGVSTYFIRCARRAGCDDYIGESNIVAKKITAYPLAQITQEPNTLCVSEGGTFSAAIAGAGATYSWDFGPNASPSTASTRVVSGVSWSVEGTQSYTLTVTRFGCSFTIPSNIFIEGCSINPLIINDLSATLDGQEVEVQWSVEGDFEDMMFVVQCAEDGENFQNLTILPATDAMAGGRFSFTDRSPRLGENTYRIRFRSMLDNDTGGYSTTASVFYQPEGVGIVSVYPNPTAGRVTVEVLHLSDEVATLTILNPLGQRIEMLEIAPGTEKYIVDLSGQKEGIYLVELKQAGYRPQVSRVVKAE